MQTFEEIIAVRDDPVWLWPAYYNIENAIAGMYHGRASEIKAAAEERLVDRSRPRDSGNLVARVADAIIKTEIEMEDQKP
ncbi:MAG: hypothetical protein ABSG65_09135 [Bryobacteraceae bacterium]